jgi:hypothetical protein
MTDVNDKDKVAEMINDVSKGTEKLTRRKKKVYEVFKRNKTKLNRVVRGSRRRRAKICRTC